jgi:2,4-dienoyl-CoA reductase-like NADH-dependent reductase (Old Yellow Enzyme family)
MSTNLVSPNLNSSNLTFLSGKQMPNRFMLAPLTNLQSHDDGTLSEDEYNWLTMRAKGGFGLTMTCAAFAEKTGKGFDGQLGAAGDGHFDGMKRLADGIKEHGSLAYTQIVHGGMRTLEKFTGERPVCPSDNGETGARAMTLDEIKATEEAFINAAILSEKAGFDGMEIHGAHGYLLCQFLSAEINRREDDYGGSLENRTRIIDNIIAGIKQACDSSFSLALRLSPARFGVQIDEIVAYYERLCAARTLDFIDMSLWDVFQVVDEGAYEGQRLVDIFAQLDRHDTKLTVAGKITTGEDVKNVLDAGVDFVALGRAGILHHDWPQKFAADENFQSIPTPVTKAHLTTEGLGPKFVSYMSTWAGFVEESA